MGGILPTTERLTLQPFTAADLDDLHSVVGDGDVMLYVGDGKPLSREATRAWIERAAARFEADRPTTYAVRFRRTGQLVGYGGLIPMTCTPNRFEVVYGLDKYLWGRGRGLGRELATALARWASDRWGLCVLYATVDPANLASLRILRGLGMELLEERRDEFGLPEQVYRRALPLT